MNQVEVGKRIAEIMELQALCSQSWRIMQGNMATNISRLVQQMNQLDFMKNADIT